MKGKNNMPWQPIEEKNAERELIKDYATIINAKILRLQEDDDDGETDGLIECNGEKRSVEARRKGYPNHSGKTCFFKDGWETQCLTYGIFLNERTIKNHKNEGFDFIVEIKGFKPRVALITPSKVNELLKQPFKRQKSTNSGAMQSVKTIPLDWFREY